MDEWTNFTDTNDDKFIGTKNVLHCDLGAGIDHVYWGIIIRKNKLLNYSDESLKKRLRIVN